MRVVTLLSGGLDSSLLFYYLREEGHTQFPLFINYGQINFEKEITSSRSICKRLCLSEPLIMDVSGYGNLIKSGLTDRNFDIVDDAFLPNRNAMFLLCAASYAYQEECTHIAIGFLNEDNHIFPDQTRDFLDSMETIIEKSLGRKINILSPFIHINKSDIIALAEKNGINGTYSCHAGGDEPCGKCISCLEFINAKK